MWRVVVYQRAGQVLTQYLANEHREFYLRNEEPVRVRLNTYYYPHWIARLDGHEIKIEAEATSGLMLTELRRVPTRSRSITKSVSGRSLGAAHFRLGLAKLCWWLLWAFMQD
jgi:hypothetical protein